MESGRFEWDDLKRIANLAKHGVDFRAIASFDWEASTIGRDMRRRYGETRFLAYGPIKDRLHAVVYTPRGSVLRIISLRKANRREQAEYAARMAGRR